ncbi:MAG: hypothetical protein J5621_08205 [Paludibacteraceae bacterium]|nr:hypothetical protein [Paludibacteraceae bacterium]
MKRGLTFVLLMSLSLFACAEHLFEIGLHGGVSGWNTRPVYVEKRIGFHGGVQIGYTYISPYVIGLHTGLTLDNQHAGFDKANYEDSYSTTDVDNQQMKIAYTIGQLSEQSSMWSVGIPMQLAFSRENISFFVGPKVVFPFANSWRQTVDSTILTVYYPDFDNTVTQSYPLATHRGKFSQKGQLALPKTQWWLSMELNYSIPLYSKPMQYRSYLIIGAYFDYCLTKTTTSIGSRKSLMMLSDTRDGFPLERIFTPIVEAQRQGRKLIGTCNLFDVGIKLSYAIAPHTARHRSTYPCRCQKYN